MTNYLELWYSRLKPMTGRKFTPLIFYLCLLFSIGCAQTKSGAVLARFDNTTITDQEFDQRLRSLPPGLKAAAARNKKRVLEDMVAEHFLLREAGRRGLANLPEVKELLELARRKILVAKLIEMEVDKKLTLESDEAQRYYESNQEEFMTPLLLRASHILVKAAEAAGVIREELLAGADFEETARHKSIDATALRGGDGGFFQRGQLVPEFEEAAFELKKGELSGVVQTKLGYHIIKLTDRIEPRLRDFQAVKPALEERILLRKKSKALKALADKLRGNTKVEIDEKALEAGVG